MSNLDLYNFDFSKKIFFHPEKIVLYKQGRRPFPTTLEVDLTDRCNHRCFFCYSTKYLKTNPASLDTNVIKQRLKEAYGLGTRGISFTGGGEPMVHKDFLEILGYSKNIGLDNGLMTNGSLINSKNAVELNRFLQWIRISMGGGDRSSYKFVQGVDQFERIIDNIKLLSQARVEMKSKLNIGIRVLVLKENIYSLEKLANILSNTNINYLQLAPDQFANDEGKFWNDDKTQQVFKIVNDVLKQNDIKLLRSGYSIIQDQLDYPRTCYAHFFQAAITAEGELTFCKNCRGNGKYYLGNINQKSLREIWNDDIVKNIESWIKPSNCGLFCKNMALNKSMEDILYPDVDMSPNFVN